MQIFVKTLTGKTVTLCVPDDVTVEEIKCGVCLEEGIPLDQQRIIYSGYQLSDGQQLSSYYTDGTINESTLHIVLRLRGGMYHCVSGRDGSYKSLKELCLDNIWEIDPQEEDCDE